MKGAFHREIDYAAFWVKPKASEFIRNPAAVVDALQAMPAEELRKRQAALAIARADVVYDVEGSRAADHFLREADACVHRGGGVWA